MEESIHLLKQWQAGSERAADMLFQRYLGRLIGLARSRLSPRLAGRVDPEDVVQSAYRSFFAGAREGQYELERGGDLWRLLTAITLHKLHDHVKRHTAGKRDARVERSLPGLELELLAREPSPLEAISLVEELQRLMKELTPLERQMLEMRLQGHTLEEIAAAVCLSRRSVCRALERVKQLWASEAGGRLGTV